ncbi:phospholipase D-like domain-containing protein [Alkalilimnicola ehrlichii]|uniref:phospholipase D-like domain-containing protein n=1 Tax=Alkalilimnicola ehrlichii TaxID=351052 RepID=UPI0026D64A64
MNPVYGDLHAHGVRIFEYQPRMLPVITLLISDTWSLVGTLNLGDRSFRQNYEINLIMWWRLLVG